MADEMLRRTGPGPVMTTGAPAPGVLGTAFHSADGRFRWLLRWRWDDGPVMVYCGLNPSTADAFTADHTARRSADFAKREGCGGMAWVNIVPYITSYPAALRSWLAAARFNAPPGRDAPRHVPWRAPNDKFITEAATGPGDIVVCAWGAIAACREVEPHRLHTALLLQRLGVTQYALAFTRAGHPAHPLRLPKTAPLTEFWPRCGQERATR